MFRCFKSNLILNKSKHEQLKDVPTLNRPDICSVRVFNKKANKSSFQTNMKISSNTSTDIFSRFGISTKVLDLCHIKGGQSKLMAPKYEQVFKFEGVYCLCK